jgi:hypothetical protein
MAVRMVVLVSLMTGRLGVVVGPRILMRRRIGAMVGTRVLVAAIRGRVGAAVRWTIVLRLTG